MNVGFDIILFYLLKIFLTVLREKYNLQLRRDYAQSTDWNIKPVKHEIKNIVAEDRIAIASS